MPGRPRETVFICADAESADEAATRATRRMIAAWTDEHICPVEYRDILADLHETMSYTERTAHRIALYDRIVEEVGHLLHNGLSRRGRKLAAEREQRIAELEGVNIPCQS